MFDDISTALLTYLYLYYTYCPLQHLNHIFLDILINKIQYLTNKSVIVKHKRNQLIKYN